MDFNIAAFVVVITAASSIPQLVAQIAIGAYAGMVGQETIDSYGWLTLLAVLVTAIFEMASRYKLLVGCSGRLGTLAFIACNITVILAAASRNVPWNRYGDSNVLWGDVLNLERSILLVVCSVAGTTAVGFYRLAANITLNAVIAATFIGFVPMLVVTATGFRHSSSMIAGFAIGAFGGMASFEKVPSTLAFAAVGLFSGLWALFLTPFFIGFGGKEGFSSLLGFATYAPFGHIWKKINGRKTNDREA